MKFWNILASIFATAQVANAYRKLQFPPNWANQEEHSNRVLMGTKKDPPPKGKGAGKGMAMSKTPKAAKAAKAAKSAKSTDYKGGKGSSEMTKGKGSSEMTKGKGKGSSEMTKGKGKGSSEMTKGKGGKGKGKGQPSLPTLGEIVKTEPDLAFLAKAMEEAQILEFFFNPDANYTVLAPDNSAFSVFASLYPQTAEVLFDDHWILHLLDLLTTHVTEPGLLSTDLSDGMTFESFSFEVITVDLSSGVCFSPAVSGSSCVAIADVMAANGVAHIVDDVLKPFWLEFSVLEILQGFPQLSILNQLIECGGLSDALANTFGITVFAPTDDALANADVPYLCSPAGKDALVDVLTYHVLPKVLPSAILEEGSTSYETLQGKSLTVTFKDNKDPEMVVVMVNDANAIATDFGAINGIVHLIDGILMPPAPSKGKGKGKGGKGAETKGKGGKGAGTKGKGGGMSVKAPKAVKSAKAKGKGAARV